MQTLALTIVILANVAACSTVGYYYCLALASMWAIRFPRDRYKSTTHRPRFAIVVPAHNEESTVAKTLLSCQSLTYPRDLFSIHVVVDNCSDRTEEAARKGGANCLVRRSETRRGKGYALEYAFQHLQDEDHDAYVVLDADCTMDPESLAEFSRYIGAGCLALQANSVVANPDASPLTYSLALGNKLENDLYYRGKNQLGLSVCLRGTGMVLSQKLLSDVPWSASSITEDLEYTERVIERGHRIHFVPHATVRSAFPTTQAQLKVQRSRWASGTFGSEPSSPLRLFLSGIKKRNLRLVDLSWSFAVLSRPFVLAIVAASLIASIGLFALVPSSLAAWVLRTSVLTTLLFAVYVLLGAVLLGITRRRVGFLLSMPVIAVRLLAITVGGALRKQGTWDRTPRS